MPPLRLRPVAMPYRIGLHLLAGRVRAVAVDRAGRPVGAGIEVAWDPASPAAAIDELRARLGVPRALGIAVGMAFVDVQRATLPPVDGEARRRLVALHPGRVFVLREPVVVALANDAPPGGAAGEPTFAVAREPVRRWCDALAAWAPVDSVEPAPTALARELAARGALPGTYLLEGSGEDVWGVRLAAGRVEEVGRRPVGRRAFDGPGADAADREGAVEWPEPWSVARGAALGVDRAPSAVLLLTGDLAQRVQRRRTVRLTRAATLCGLAAGLAIAGADRQRSRQAAAIEQALRAERPRAATAESLLTRLTALDAAARATAAVRARRADALAGLDALSARLPAEAVVSAVRMDASGWTVDGTAPIASAVAPAVAGDPRIADVREASPGMRIDEGGRAVETFTVHFRVRTVER